MLYNIYLNQEKISAKLCLLNLILSSMNLIKINAINCLNGDEKNEKLFLDKKVDINTGNE